MIEGICKIAGCSRLAVRSIALFAYRDDSGENQYNISYVCDNCFHEIMDYFEKGDVVDLEFDSAAEKNRIAEKS